MQNYKLEYTNYGKNINDIKGTLMLLKLTNLVISSSLHKKMNDYERYHIITPFTFWDIQAHSM